MAHHCHATNCKIEVSPEMLMCKPHWFSLPRVMRNQIWKHYRAGQCDDMKPSKEYCLAARNCIIYIANREGIEPETRLYDMFLRDYD